MADVLDVAIIGGGPVGSALAVALSGSGLAVRVFDAGLPAARGAGLRPVALAHGSRLVMERLGAWRLIDAPTPIEHIHVSQRGGFGRVTLSAIEAGLPALGYVAEYGGLAGALAEAAMASGCYSAGTRVAGIQAAGERLALKVSDRAGELLFTARFAAVADGGALDGIASTRVTDYGQTAVAACVSTAAPHRNTAYERFTPEGPLALLPFGDGYALVWTVSPDRAADLIVASEARFTEALQDAFGSRLGQFTRVSDRSAYPLALRYATGTLLPRVALIGNAAQTLHPVAGQGFNLGLRDAWELAEIIRSTPVPDLGGAAMLRRYRARRRMDRAGGIAFTHGLVQAFSNGALPLEMARGTGLAILGCLPTVKDFVVRRMTFGARG